MKLIFKGKVAVVTGGSGGIGLDVSKKLAKLKIKVLILDITDVPRLGVTATLAIEDMMQEAKLNSRKAYVAGASGKV